jgi:hypothetical protein
MAIDIKKLDEKIRKLQQLRELAADPELADMLSAFVSANGSKAADNGTSAQAEGDGRLAYAEKAVHALAGHFTVKEAATKMVELGYTFTAKDPSVATYGALLLLRDKGIVEVAEKGGPGKSAKWRAVR